MSPEIRHLRARIAHCATVCAERAAVVSDLLESGAELGSCSLATGWLHDAAADLAHWCRELDRAAKAQSGPVDHCPHILDLEDDPRDDLDMVESFDEGTVVPLGWPGVLA